MYLEQLCRSLNETACTIRRRACKSGLVAFAMALVFTLGCTEKRELHLYTWADYISPEVIEAFEKEYDCKVVIDTFDTNEAMYAKLKAGATGYDVYVPSSYMVKLLAKEKLIVPLEHSKCPSLKKNFFASYSKMLPEDPTLEYAAPYSCSPTILFYDPKHIPEGVEMNTWAVLGNPAFKGRIQLLDDMREVIGAGLMYLGYSINSVKQEEIDAAVNQVLKWKENVRKFDSESYKTEVAAGSSWIGQGFGQVARQVILGEAEDGSDARHDLKYAYPKEGYTHSCEELVVSSTASNPDLAYKLIEFLYGNPEMGAKNMEYVLGMLPSVPAIEALDKEIRDIVVESPEIMSFGQVILGIENIPAATEMYAKAWDRIKASK